MKRILALSAAVLLTGCFQNANPAAWGIASAKTSTPIPFRQWRVCKVTSQGNSLSECFQTGFEQVDSGYRLTNPQKNLPKSVRFHSLNAAASVMNTSTGYWGWLLRADKMSTKGQAYLLFIPQCRKVRMEEFTANERTKFERKFDTCKFKPGTQLGDMERIVAKAAKQKGTSDTYAIFEPGAKVFVSDKGHVSDGSRADGLPGDIKSKVNGWITRASRSWFINRLDPGSIRNIRLKRGNFYQGRAVVYAQYTQNNGTTAAVDIELQDGKPRCMRYGDFPMSCRPYR